MSKQVDPRDVALYLGLGCIGGGIAWWVHPGAGLLSVGVLLFGIGWISTGRKGG